MPFNLQDAIFPIVVILFLTGIFSTYFSGLVYVGYNNPAVDNNTLGNLINFDSDYLDLNGTKNVLQDVNLSNPTIAVETKDKSVPQMFFDFIGNIQNSACQIGGVKELCSAMGATGLIGNILLKSITWATYFIDKIFPPSNPSLATLGLGLKFFFMFAEVVGLLYFILYVTRSIIGVVK
jgi:hypothetical protein